MTMYLYKKPGGYPDLLPYKLPPGQHPDYEFVREVEGPLATNGMIFSEDGQLVPIERGYDEKRRSAYPRIGDQLDMLWHAMNNGQIPRVEPFYSEILSVKQSFPKPSN